MIELETDGKQHKRSRIEPSVILHYDAERSRDKKLIAINIRKIGDLCKIKQ
jgi:predicted HNH restriction endonuclease